MSIKHETITVMGTVIYCDACGRQGPVAAYDNADEVIDLSQDNGWENDDKDYCPACVKEREQVSTKRRNRAASGK